MTAWACRRSTFNVRTLIQPFAETSCSCGSPQSILNPFVDIVTTQLYKPPQNSKAVYHAKIDQKLCKEHSVSRARPGNLPRRSIARVRSQSNPRQQVLHCRSKSKWSRSENHSRQRWCSYSCNCEKESPSFASNDGGRQRSGARERQEKDNWDYSTGRLGRVPVCPKSQTQFYSSV